MRALGIRETRPTGERTARALETGRHSGETRSVSIHHITKCTVIIVYIHTIVTIVFAIKFVTQLIHVKCTVITCVMQLMDSVKAVFMRLSMR